MSLQTLCLSVIVKHFERFHSAKEMNNENFKWSLLFLQRKFSEHLYKKLLAGPKNLYFDFLVNPYLKSIDYELFKHTPIAKSIDDFFGRLPNLSKVKFNSSGDKILKSITKFCPNLVEIDATFSGATDAGLKCLYEIINGSVPCPKLQKIDVYGTHVTDKGIENLLQFLPSLQRINYTNLPLVIHSVHKEKLNETQNLPSYNLIEINLTKCDELPDYPQILKTCVAVCPKLVHLSCSVTSYEQLQELNCRYLENLKLIFRWPLKANIDDFIRDNVRNLTSLSINNCVVSISVLSVHCPVLTELLADNVTFVDDSETFPSLIECSLYGDVTLVKEGFCLLTRVSPNLISVAFKCDIIYTMYTEIIDWCRNTISPRVTFINTYLDTVFIRAVLLNCHTLRIYECPSDNTQSVRNNSIMELVALLPYKVIVDIRDCTDS